MDRNKRNFLGAIFPWALAVPLGLLAQDDAGQQQEQPHRPTPMPHVDNSTEPDLPKPDPDKILKHNQQKIQDDVEKLYKLAWELKEQVEKTDSTNVLSVQMIQKAEEIEKLAKQVKTLARAM